MSQLHELLAVEGDLKGTKDKIIQETIKVFEKKQEHFSGGVKILEMFDDARKNEEAAGGEQRELETTVNEKLDYMSEIVSKYWDAKLQKELSNQEASADIVINGQTIMKSAPVTFLLSMEDELKRLHKVYDSIPTLQIGVEWEKDETIGPNIFKTKNPVIRSKTEKVHLHKIMVPATEKHPAQIREWTEDRPIGQYVATTWSGALSSAEKSIILGRLDNLLRAIKQARQRANTQEVSKGTIGTILFNYIHKG